MSSELEKFLAKVTPKEKKIIAGLIQKIVDDNLENFDIKKRSGNENVFRIRKGTLRILFQLTKTDRKIISIERRNDTTYTI